MASKSQTSTKSPEKATAPGDAAVVAKPTDGAGFYELRLVKRPKGPRRRIVKIGNAVLRFNASQEDPKMVDFPAKKLHLTLAELAQFKADSDYQVTKANVEAPKKNSLGFSMGRRTIDDGKTVKIGEGTAVAPDLKPENDTEA